jgi:hypothetical protein
LYCPGRCVLSRRNPHFAACQVYWECRRGIWRQDQDEEVSYVVNPCWPAVPETLDAWEKHQLVAKTSHMVGSPLGGRIKTTLATAYRPAKCHQKFHVMWSTVLEIYSSLLLTKGSDRTPALLRAIERIRKRTGFNVYHGHWYETLRCFLNSLA